MSGQPPTIDDLDIAVAHWHVNSWGGAEYLVTKLATVLGAECVYTLGEPTPDTANPYGSVDFEDVTSELDYPRTRRFQRLAGRTFEYAQWEDVDWREFGGPDILVTSGATTRAVITPDDVGHLHYCHSPPRWLYDLYHDRKQSTLGKVIRPLLRYLRTKDVTVDPRVDRYLSNSPIIKRRLWKFLKRESTVLYPPVKLKEYHNDGDHGYYLHLGRLDEQKGVSAIVRAFEGTDRDLILAGGRGDVDEQVLTDISNAPNIEYRGFVSDSQKRNLLARCSAVVFNGRNEDFGIVPIEANASGKPAIVPLEGFPGVFVRDGKNGYRHDRSPEGIRSEVRRFEERGVSGNPQSFVDRFSLNHFSQQLKSEVKRTAEAVRINDL